MGSRTSQLITCFHFCNHKSHQVVEVNILFEGQKFISDLFGLLQARTEHLLASIVPADVRQASALCFLSSLVPQAQQAFREV